MLNPSSLFNALPIQNTQVVFDDAFRNMLEDHLPWLLASSGSSPQTVDPATAYQFNNDFYGLLDTLGVPWYMQWITLRINGYTDPSDYTNDNLTIIVPPSATVNQLLNLYQSVSSVVG